MTISNNHGYTVNADASGGDAQLAQAANNALDEIESVLMRMKELSEQAAGNSLGDMERACLQDEIEFLKTELDRVSNTAEYNGQKLFDGSAPGVFVPNGWDRCVFYS